MKKLLTFVFVFAAVLVGANVLSSCKDYDEDNYDDLQIQLDRNDTDLRTLIGNNYNTLYTLYLQVKQAQEQCEENCSLKFVALNESIAQLIIKDSQLQTAINGKADTATVNALKRDVTGIKDDINNINVDIALLKQNDSIMNATLTTIQNTITNIQNDITYLTGRAVQDSTDIADLLSRVQTNEGNISTLMTTVHQLDSTIRDIKSDINTINLKFDNYYTKNETDSLDSILNAKIDTLESTVNNKLILLEGRLNDVATDASNALALAQSDSIWIEELKKVTWNADSILAAKIDSLKQALEELELGKDTVVVINKDTLYITDGTAYVLQSVYDAYVDSTDQKIADLQEAVEPLAGLIQQAEQNRKDADELLQQQINAIILALRGQGADLGGLRDSVKNILDVKLPSLEQAYKDADEALKDAIDDLADKVQKNADDISDLSDALDDLTDRVADNEKKIADLEKKMNQITGIIPQAVVNPVYGTFNTPVGINSKILVAFYGEVGQMVEFPTKETANYVKNSQKFTDKEWAMISSVAQETLQPGTIISGDDGSGVGKAGTLYLTVNPSEVNYAGQTLTLVNSKDEESKVVLSALEKENDYLINFGYTRAAADNGFYRAEATLNKADVEAVKADINVEGMVEDFKDVLTKRNASSVGTLANTLYKQFNGIVPAQALKAEWTATLEDGSTYTRTYRSDYGLAATAIKPLSYKFLEDLDVVTIPGYERVISAINRIAKEVKKTIQSTWPDLSGFDADAITLNKITSVDPNRFSVKFSFAILTDGIDSRAYKQTIGDLEYIVVENRQPISVDAAGNVNDYQWVVALKMALNDEDAVAEQSASNPLKWDLTITKNVGNVDDILDSVNGAMDDIADFIKDVNDMLDDINAVETTINSKTGSLVTKLHNLVDRINSRATSLINSANSRLQPVLLLSGSETGAKRASRASGQPTIVKDANITLFPTSYTADIVAPAYLKHVAVINVTKGSANAQDGDADCKAVLDGINADLNKVLPGDTKSVDVTLKAGYTYEVAFSAVDYAGNISMHKYYIKY